MRRYKYLFIEVAEPNEKDITIGSHTFGFINIFDEENNFVSAFDYYALENVRIDVDNRRLRLFPALCYDYLTIESDGIKKIAGVKEERK